MPLTSMASIVPKVTKAACGKQGVLLAELFSAWGAIVGPEPASYTWPEKLYFPQNEKINGSLRIGVKSSCAPFVRYQLDTLINRINVFLGYPAIAEIRMRQCTARRKRNTTALTPRTTQTPAEPATVLPAVQDITDNDLKNILNRLGQAVAQKG